MGRSAAICQAAWAEGLTAADWCHTFVPIHSRPPPLHRGNVTYAKYLAINNRPMMKRTISEIHEYPGVGDGVSGWIGWSWQLTAGRPCPDRPVTPVQPAGPSAVRFHREPAGHGFGVGSGGQHTVKRAPRAAGGGPQPATLMEMSGGGSPKQPQPRHERQ